MAQGIAQIKIVGNVTEAVAALHSLGIKAEEVSAKTAAAFDSSNASSGASKVAAFGKRAAEGLVGVAVASIKMAGDFQESMTTLVTGAGESEGNIKKVADGILKMGPQVGTTTKQLADGMYMIESAGYHGAEGLSVLKAAAEGAKVGGSDLKTVADAVTTALRDYHLPADQAATVTSKLVATVASGKTHMGDLAGSLATVLPAASSAGVGLNQVLGAMATMTAGGTPAADAATYLKQTIMQLSNPTAKARSEMESLGLSSIDVSKNLGTRGLSGTLDLLTSEISSHMGPAGTVLIEQMKSASHNTTKFQQVLANLPPTQQTYVAALADMVGGTKSMQAALELSGSNAKDFAGNVSTIGAATTEAGGHVQGFGLVQKDFNFKLEQAKVTVETLGIKLGTVLIPVVEQVARDVQQVVVWFGKHKTVAEALGVVVGGALVVAIGAYTVSMITAAATTIAATWPILAIIAAIGLLVGGAYELATHWSQVWGWIRREASDAWRWIDQTFIQPFQRGFAASINWLSGAWTAVYSSITSPFVAAWNDVYGLIHSFMAFWSGIGNAIAGTAIHMWDSIGDGFKGMLNWVITLWDWIANCTKFDLPSVHIPLVGDVGGGSIGPLLPTLPHLAQGGVTTGPTLAMIGDNPSGREAIVPLEKAAGMGFGGGDGGPVTVVIQMNGRETARALWPDLRSFVLQNTSRNAPRVGLG